MPISFAMLTSSKRCRRTISRSPSVNVTLPPPPSWGPSSALSSVVRTSLMSRELPETAHRTHARSTVAGQQRTEGPEVEVEVLGGEAELLGQLVHRLLQV